MLSSGKSMDICEEQAQKLLAVEEALALFLKSAPTVVQTESVAISQSLGRVLATAHLASFDMPPMDNSAMDGYAIALADLENSSDRRLQISQLIAAGAAVLPFEQGTTARIFTGAPVPSGADAVIPQEACQIADGWVTFPEKIALGANIRRQGEEVHSGQTLLEKGQKIRPQELAMLATLGLAEVEVIRPLRVAIFSTGDELTPLGEPLKSGHIYDSNRYALMALLQSQGHQIIDLGCIPDQLDATCEALKKAAEQADLIVTSGGVSVGDEDHVKNAVIQLGHLDSWRIAIKPGKPLAYGNVQGTPFFGLPGNPVATFITFCLFVRPYLQKMQGIEITAPLTLELAAGFSRKAGKRSEYLRTNIKNNRLVPHNQQGSAMMSSLIQSDGLVMVPQGKMIEQGDLLQFIPYSAYFS